LYQQDSYRRRFEATITAVDAEGGRVELDHTAFYPGGGGQPCDLGTLGEARVVGVCREESKVWHSLEGGPLPSIGNRVVGEIDWSRRYLLMRTHTALHILCGVVWRDLEALVTGGNMGPGEGRLDFELPRLERSLVDELEAKCNEEVQANREVRVQILPRDEAMAIPDLIRTKVNLLPAAISEVRTVEIVGLDLQADGGTHVANTGEVGQIRIVKYKSKGAINKRLYLRVDDG
jgi:misacylated tRNA(Ala) deacylase